MTDYIIYPNKIFPESCLDKSNELLDGDDPNTRIYEQNGITLDLQKRDNSSNIFNLKLTEPDLSNPEEKNSDYIGTLATDDTNIDVCKRFKDEQHEILNEINYSLLEITLITPIKPREKRFLRITTKPDKTAIIQREKSDAIIYNYDIT